MIIGVPKEIRPDMPGAVGRTGTFALTDATMPYVTDLARYGCPAAAAARDGIG